MWTCSDGLRSGTIGKEQDALKHEQETAVQIWREGEWCSRQREQHLAKAQGGRE